MWFLAGPGSPASRPGVLAAARSCFARLMEGLVLETDGGSRLQCWERGGLSQRLAQGLDKLRASQSDAAAALTSKVGPGRKQPSCFYCVLEAMATPLPTRVLIWLIHT